jgi:type IV secretory pathway VirB2 component (pilin)
MKNFKKLAVTIFSFLILFQVFLSSPVSAQLLNNTAGLDSMTIETKNAAGLGDMSIGQAVSSIIKVVLGLLSIIFLILIIIAGFKWMTAGGNEEQIKKSTATIKSAVIGLVIVLAAYTITYFIFTYLPFTSSGSIMQGDTSG